MATLTRLSAESIAEAMKRVETSAGQQTVYLSGGGAHNPLMLKYLSEILPGWKMLPMETLGVHGDAKEAVLFAVLANETVAGTVEKKGLCSAGFLWWAWGKFRFQSSVEGFMVYKFMVYISHLNEGTSLLLSGL